MINGLIPEVGVDGKGGSGEATCPMLVGDEGVPWRPNRAPWSLVRVLAGQHRRAFVDTADFPFYVAVLC